MTSSRSQFNFIQQYVYYNSGNEVPPIFHMWTAVVLLAAAAHKRIYIDPSLDGQGYFKVDPAMFVTLVAKQGKVRKSSAKDIGANIFTTALPKYPLGAAVQSREDIVRNMSGESCKIKYIDEENAETVVTPCVFFINELKNFLSVDPQKMIEFLTDVYGSKKFDSGTIKRGGELIVNPCINILACEVPDWITDKLRTGIVSGGFARRMIYVYETDRYKRIAFPTKPKDHFAVFKGLTEHLERIYHTVPPGPLKWTSAAVDWYAPWYEKLQFPDDENMAGFYESKHIQLFKVAICLALAEHPFRGVLDKDHLTDALTMLDVIEPNMAKLTVAAGRNELALPTQKLLEVLDHHGGMMPDKVFTRLAMRDLNMSEIMQIKRLLQDTEQIVIKQASVGGVVKMVVFTRAKYLEQEKAELKRKEEELCKQKTT